MTKNTSPPSQKNVSRDEISFRELIDIIWRSRAVVILSTVVFSLGSMFYALFQPNIYQSTSSFLLENNFYSIAGINEPYFTPEYFESRALWDGISLFSTISESELGTVVLSYKESKSKLDSVKSGVITISTLSTDPQLAFDNVVKVGNVLNEVMKLRELDKVTLSLDKLSRKTDSSYTHKTKEYLDEILAQQLFKKAILESPESSLLQVATLPAKPDSHIKPKRILITIMGAILGAMIGIVLVLFRFAYKN